MKSFAKLQLVVIIFLIVLGGTSMAQDDDMMDEPIVAVQNVFWSDTDMVVEDAEAVLVRMHHGLSMTVETTGLEPGDAYTVWWVIFNNPEECSDGICNIEDVFLMEDGEFALTEDGMRQPNVAGREMTQVSSLRATGNIGYIDGTSVFRAHLPIGDTTDHVNFGPGLLDSMNTEVHLIIRTHGPIIPELLNEQLMTAWGGCPDPMDRSPCDDVQIAIFPPAMSP
ncbi:MAG: hypothetical protein RLP44_26660 [Aggregatilineales bacterium]